MIKTAAKVDNEIAWYEVRFTDYYGEFFELVPVCFSGQWPQQFPKLEAPTLFTKEGVQLFVEWPKETVLETAVAINGETSVKVDMSAPADSVKTQKLFVPIERYGHKIMVCIPKGTRLRVG